MKDIVKLIKKIAGVEDDLRNATSNALSGNPPTAVSPINLDEVSISADTPSTGADVVSPAGGGADNDVIGPGGKGPARPAGGTGKGTYRPGNKAVIKMQQAMQQFANYIMDDVKYSDLPIVNAPDIKRKQSTDQRNRGSFMDFFAQNFVGELPEDRRGVEWSDDPNAKSYEEKKQGETSVYQMKVVMDTISRIGTSSKEFRPDGRWEWRTHNALKNIMGFGFALLQLAGEMKVPSNSFSPRRLLSFKTNLDKIEVDGKDVKLTPKQETDYANLFTKDIYGILSLYKDIRERVVGNPKFRPYLEEDRAFGKVTEESAFDKQKKEIIKNRNSDQYKPNSPMGEKVIYVSIGKGSPAAVPLSALTSVANYLSWAERMGFPKEQAVNVFTGFIKPEIEKRYNQFQSQQVEQKQPAPETAPTTEQPAAPANPAPVK